MDGEEAGLGAGGGGDESGVGGGEDALETGVTQVVHEEAVAGWVELAGDIVEEEEGRGADAGAQVFELGDFEGEDDGALLALGAEGACRALADDDVEVVGVWSERGEAAFEIAAEAFAQGALEGFGDELP